MPYHLNYGLKP